MRSGDTVRSVGSALAQLGARACVISETTGMPIAETRAIYLETRGEKSASGRRPEAGNVDFFLADRHIQTHSSIFLSFWTAALAQAHKRGDPLFKLRPAAATMAGTTPLDQELTPADRVGEYLARCYTCYLRTIGIQVRFSEPEWVPPAVLDDAPLNVNRAWTLVTMLRSRLVVYPRTCSVCSAHVVTRSSDIASNYVCLHCQHNIRTAKAQMRKLETDAKRVKDSLAVQ